MLVLLFAGHVSHQIVDKFVHLLDILCEISLVLETHHIVSHLDHQTARTVVILGAVANLDNQLHIILSL